MSELIIMMRSAITLPLSRLKTDSLVEATRAPTSNGRLYALDLARFIAMVFMMQGHVLDALVNRSELVVTEFPWNIWHLIRGFTAPIFLMVSGAVHAFATKRDPDGLVRADVINKRIRWAFTIIGIGYVLTFPASKVWDLPFVSAESWRNFLAVNILQLTGATMLLFTVVVASTKSLSQMGRRALYTAGAILVLTPVMEHTSNLTFLPLWLQAYVTSATGSLFPLFPFGAYLFVGLFFGTRLARVPREQRDDVLLHKSWRYGVVVAVVGVLSQYTLWAAGVSMDVLEGPMSIPLFIRRVGVVLMVFSAAVWVLNHTWSLRNWYSLFGTKSLWIYVVHLIILFGTPWHSSIGRVRYHDVSLPIGITVAVGVILATLFIAWLFDWYAKQPWAKRWSKPLMAVAYTTLLFVLMF